MPTLAIALNSEQAAARTAALWALHQVDGPNARKLLREQLTLGDLTARQIAARSAGLARDMESVPALVQLLDASEPEVRRVAAEALGRMRARTPRGHIECAGRRERSRRGACADLWR